MKKLLLYVGMIIFYNLLSPTFVQAQEMKAKKYDNPEWKSIGFIKFKSGKVDRAKEIIKNYYMKAGEKAGTPGPAMLIDLKTGEWDMMVLWDMKGGIEEMNWEMSPNDVKWMTAMNDIAGGGDKAKTIMDEFSSLVDRETSYIGKIAVLK